jgi:putative membrane protein
LGIFLRGLVMGTVDIVPGVSGGTVAFITGIYPRLIHGLNQIRNETQIVLKSPTQLTNSIKNIDWKFFIPLAVGIAMALFLLSGIMSYFLENFPANTFALFAGLILASAYMLFKTLGEHNNKNFAALFFGITIAYLLAGLTALDVAHTYPIIFFSGAIAICAMLLPGISGAFLLVLLGQYEYVIAAIHERNLLIVAIFGAGAILGLAIFSKLVDTLLQKHKNLTLYALTGLMIGALRVPYLEISLNIAQTTYAYIIYFIILGVGIVIAVDYAAKIFKK